MVDNNRNKQIAKNTIALYFRTAFTMVISLYVARAVLDALGEQDYGIYNVVGSIVVTFSFFNTSLQSAIQRFFSFALGKEDNERLCKIFSMSIIILSIMVMIIVLLADSIGLWFLNNKLNIPFNRLSFACYAFQFSIVTFGLSMIRIPFEALVVAHEKMSFFAYLSLLEQGLRIGIVFCLYNSSFDKLILYSILLSFVSLVTLIIYILFCRRKFPYCSFTLLWNKQIFTELFSFSGWTLLGSSTALGTQQALVFLLNVFYGVVANAALGISNHVVNAINSFVGGFQTAFRPQIVKSYAQKDDNYVHQLICSTSKISFLLMFYPGILIICNTPFLLELWLNNVPEYTVSFCRLFLVCSIIDATTGPYNAAIMASGKIRNYQIAISSVFCLDIVCICLMFLFGVGAEYILYSRIATRGFLNMFVGLFFLRKQLNFDVIDYYKRVLFRIIAFILINLPILIIAYYWLSPIYMFFFSCFWILFFGSIIGFRVILDEKEKNIINTFIHSNKFLNKLFIKI